MINTLIFCLFWKIFIISSISKDSFAGHTILNWHFFSPLQYIIPFSPGLKVSGVKSTYRLIGFPFYVTFSLLFLLSMFFLWLLPISCNAFWCNPVKLSCVRFFAHPWTIALHAPLEFSRQEYWSVKPFPSPGNLPNTGIKPRSPALQGDSLSFEPQWSWH